MMSSLLPIPFPSPKCSSLEPALRGGGGGVGGGESHSLNQLQVHQLTPLKTHDF